MIGEQAAEKVVGVREIATVIAIGRILRGECPTDGLRGEIFVLGRGNLAGLRQQQSQAEAADRFPVAKAGYIGVAIGQFRANLQGKGRWGSASVSWPRDWRTELTLLWLCARSARKSVLVGLRSASSWRMTSDCRYSASAAARSPPPCKNSPSSLWLCASELRYSTIVGFSLRE